MNQRRVAAAVIDVVSANGQHVSAEHVTGSCVGRELPVKEKVNAIPESWLRLLLLLQGKRFIDSGPPLEQATRRDGEESG